MASQLGVVTGNKRLRPNQLADLNARLSYLPQTLAAESQEAFQKAQIGNMEENTKINQSKLGLDQQRLGLDTKRLGLEEQGLGLQTRTAAFNQKATTKGMDLKERAEGMAAGVGAAGLGFNLLTNTGLKSSLGETINKAGTSMNWGEPVKAGSFWNDIPVGASAAGGLMGFGASRMVPTKNKLVKFGVGAGAGALTGFFGGGDKGMGGAIGGGLLGGFAGLF